MASATALLPLMIASRAAAGKPGVPSARCTPRRSMSAPTRRERVVTPCTPRHTSPRAPPSARREPTASATAVGSGGSLAAAPSSWRTRGPISSAISDAVARARSSSSVAARSASRAGGGLRPRGATSEAGVSTKAVRSACRTAASPSRALSSTRMSCSVDPSGSISSPASSRVASAWPAPRSTVAVAAVASRNCSLISTSFEGERPPPPPPPPPPPLPRADDWAVGTTTPTVSAPKGSADGARTAGPSRPSIARRAALERGERSVKSRRAR
mmetsp:Transcript_14466/g.42908  ORF Transcript_14466/g.42908 Transcript_14466/m.42908 type:complete len:271 (+) Transcript_14466:71-883(+)